MQFKNPKGFTILEILVVVVIIGLLATAVMVNGLRGRAQSRDARRLDDISEIQKALKLYYIDNNKYPTTPGGNGECLGIGDNGGTAGQDLDSLLVSYLNPMPQDPTQTSFASANSCGDTSSTTRQYYYFYDDTHNCRFDSNNNKLAFASLHVQTLETTIYNNDTKVCPNRTDTSVPDNQGQFRTSHYRIVFEEVGS